MKRTMTASFALMILAASGLAHAEPEKTETTEKDVLKGPKVVTTDTSTSTNQDSMTSSDKQAEDQMDPEVELKKNPVIFREYITALRAAKNNTDLDITDSQQEQIAAIMKDHRQAMADFQEANRDQIRQMRDRMQAAGDRSNKESTDDKQSNDRNMEAREKLRAFIDNAAPNKEAISKLKQVLTPEQMTALDGNILKLRARVKEGANRPARARQGAEDGSDEARPARKRMNPDEAQPTGDRPARTRKGDRPKPEDD